MSTINQNQDQKTQRDLNELGELISALRKGMGSRYYSKSEYLQLFNQLTKIEQDIKNNRRFWNILNNFKTNKATRVLRDELSELNRTYLSQNRNYLARRQKLINPEVFRHGSRSLDEYQSAPILVDEHNVLVIAGAGTGKTSTIVGRIKYLLLEKKVHPKSILALTYTNASSEDMKKRIKKDTGIEMDVRTFHKIGKDILTQVEGRVPQISESTIFEAVKDIVKCLVVENHDFRIRMFDYLNYHRYLEHSQFDFKTPQEYEQFKRLNPYVTLKGETVRSGEEVLIANFLFTNQIDYIYEKRYVIDTNDQEYGQYYPDFFLPKQDIWIEHFSIDRQMNVPPFFNGGHRKSAKQLYLDGMEWKRRLHESNGTKLIETYSYEVHEGTILSSLKSRLESQSVVLEPISDQELLKALDGQRSILDGLNEIFSTVINHVRNQNLTSQQFMLIPMDPGSSKLRELIVCVLDEYIKMLSEAHAIDFSDMLNKAIDQLNAGRFVSPYSYVIVDEFQDMTDLTYRFLLSLRKTKDYQLMCVGDDWQSIYRFAGSNLDYVVHFDKYFGSSEQFFIRNTYRFNQAIARVSGTFIQQNPHQVKKELRSAVNQGVYGVGIIEGNSDWVCVTRMAEKLSELPEGKTVLFLGRYNNDVHILKNSKQFSYQYSQAKKCVEVHYEQKKLEISFRTVHGSKGLEADYVFILNTKRGSYGFPSQIQDPRIIEYLLKGGDNFPFSEERRLFYVALTRTRQKVWILVNDKDKSVFVSELQSQFGEEFDKEKFSCPVCEGHLSPKVGKYGKFIGCSNYPECTYTRSIGQNSPKT